MNTEKNPEKKTRMHEAMLKGLYGKKQGDEK